MRRILVSSIVLAAASLGAQAQNVQVRVTIQNLSPTSSVSFAPLRVGFHNGTFDAFNNGQAANAATISIAEGGSGADWFPAFMAAEPNATLGSIGGALTPGMMASNTFMVNPSVNRFFTFASMVIPSNDHFIGNDNPMGFMLFTPGGDLNITSISQFGSSIWDAGSETQDPANAAFVVGGVNAQRVAENGVVNFNFDRLDTFNGLTTAAGYVFNRQITASTEIYRISFEIVPTPAAASALALGALIAGRRRRA